MLTTAAKCPECGCQRLYRAGLRLLSDGSETQRWLCRECGYRFSFGHNGSKTQSAYGSKRQVCVLDKKAKNLALPETETVKGEVAADVKGKLAMYMVKATRRGLAERTIKNNVYHINWLSSKASLDDPTGVWQVINNKKGWKTGTKQCVATAYKSYARTMKIPLPEDLNFSKWVLGDRLPSYIPTEKEVMALISGCCQKTSTMLQLLYETGIRSGEAWRLKWDNFDFERKTLTLNAEHCEKKGEARQFKVSDKLVSMLNLLRLKRRDTEYVFNNGGRSLSSFGNSFNGQRKRLARKLQNPNLRKITLHTLRHFYACKLYHETKDILLVQSKLGHRNIQNTMVYTRLVEWEQPDNWTVRRPRTAQEEDELIEAGFIYVRFDDKQGTPIYRKRK